MPDTPNTPPNDVQGVSIPAEYVNADGQILGRFANVQELLDAVGAANAGTPPPAAETGNNFPNHNAGTPGQPEATGGAPATPEGDLPGFQIGAPETPADKSGLTPEFMQSLGQEVLSNGGKLSDESYTKLEGMGVSKAAADMHIAGQMALAKAQQTQVESALGGNEKIQETLNWAKRNLSAEQISQIDADLRTASPQGQENILRGLMARGGISTGTIAGSNAQPLSALPFRSQAEQDEAFQDPRYDSSSAYRADLEKRLKATHTVNSAT